MKNLSLNKTFMTKKEIKKIISKYPIFYQKVWEAAMTIPSGEVRTYSWIAEKIGCPKGSRAVGLALGKNPILGIIPCHRVVRKDGSLGGFSAERGIEQKIEMLEEEGIKIINKKVVFKNV